MQTIIQITHRILCIQTVFWFKLMFYLHYFPTLHHPDPWQYSHNYNEYTGRTHYYNDIPHHIPYSISLYSCPSPPPQ